ncbi:16S rRNA (uracil(1498)-N(3))-methyltransferase [Maritimibacter dapengensis]|uniref:Ribosomal RNA small subunit methyltransferase E n=1 Tax=Maritimibacter dapengensis TaxID=2836868 RepID=A0ABS6SYY7_9RHOB|nr:16S rRNA (uracil(1498)-N(3))-methyltransferase [Maritimibacter dapengensis]MBV7377357.1 16S rRNA (uracil(1498)-N(3))-methyltransferase [Maritimibacter dapengensis]
MDRAKIRLFVDEPLGEGQTIPLDQGQAHYLFMVLRTAVGDPVAVFNGRDGEWTAEITAAAKKSGELTCRGLAAPQLDPPDLWLLFAPIKKQRTDFIVEKAAEMGARRIVPVLTDFTNSERVRVDRLQAHAVEAAEQCGGTFVPEVAEPVRLTTLLEDWDDRRIMFCDETLAGSASDLADEDGVPWAILIGPEGGFSEAERSRLAGMGQAQAVSLGPRILRADTAAIAAMTLWQSTHGDWS